mgnify:FL=1
MVDTDKKTVYCSGALFSPEELASMSEISQVLETHGYNTYLPQRDGVEAFVMNAIDRSTTNSRLFRPLTKLVNRAVFALDIYQIVDACDYFVFNMNGRVPDEGGVVETAVALTRGKPIIIYKNDQRNMLFGFDSPMLMGASYTYSVVDEIGKIPSELNKLIEKMDTLGDYQPRADDLPPMVKQASKFGRKVWRFIQAIQFLKPTNQLLKNNELVS